MSGKNKQLRSSSRPQRRLIPTRLRLAPRGLKEGGSSRPERRKAYQLVGKPQGAGGKSTQTVFDQPISGATDPRWVLAVRAADQLQGDILTPKRRQELTRLGELLGLTPFSVSLIIAIVQDQARRGNAPEDCPSAGEVQLRMVRLPEPRKHRINPLLISLAVTLLLATELALIHFWISP